MSFYNKDFDFAQIENIIASIFCIVPIRLLVAMILAIVGWKKSKTGVAKAVLGYSIAQVVLCCVMVAACFGWFYLIPWLIAPYGTY
ncbi:MAG: hypothetical protein J5781_04845 [Clostridia bacterium]|nr:hypothetical protein [Clostridia bacterium]